MKFSRILNFFAVLGFVLQSSSLASTGELKANHIHLTAVSSHHTHSHDHSSKRNLSDRKVDDGHDNQNSESRPESSNRSPNDHQHKHSDIAQALTTATAILANSATAPCEVLLAVQLPLPHLDPVVISFHRIFRPPQFA